MSDSFDTFRCRVEEGVEFLSSRLSSVPETAIILGTGLGAIIDNVDDQLILPYGDIPGFSPATVVGHAGNLVYGTLGSEKVVILQGRLHYYEGYSTRDLTIPVRVLALLGVKNLIITNAAGGLNKDFLPGIIMLIRDHINLISDNPLRGPNIDAWGPRFPDMSSVYDGSLAEKCSEAAADLGLNIVGGTYCALPGPSLETPAETRYLRQCGADAVGMSTIPEVIVARHGGMRVLGLSVIANVNDPDNFQPILIDDVLVNMENAAFDLGRLINRIVAG